MVPELWYLNYWDWGFSVIQIHWDRAFPIAYCSEYSEYSEYSIRVLGVLGIHCWISRYSLLDIPIFIDGLFEGDYSKEWHLVPELWYLNLVPELGT